MLKFMVSESRNIFHGCICARALKTCALALTLTTALLAGSEAESLSPQVMAKVEAVVKTYFTGCQRDQIHIVPLTGGYSATSVLIDAEGKKYVLRLIKDSEHPTKIKKEIYAMQAAATLGVAPSIRMISAQGHEILMDFISGGTLSVEQAKRPDIITQVAEAARKVHSIPKNPYSSPSFIEVMESFYQEVSQGSHGNAMVESAIAIIQEGDQQLKALHSPAVNTHGDLNPRNILAASQTLYFIDWSEGMYTEPFHDLAYYSALLDYSAKEEELLLQSYLQRKATKEEQARFLVAKKMNLARLAIGAQYVVNKLVLKNGEAVDATTSLKNWSYYATVFASNCTPLPAQFFDEIGRAALRLAREIELQ